MTLTLTRIVRAPSPPPARAAVLPATGAPVAHGESVPAEPWPHDAGAVPTAIDIVEEWGVQSFPASDPPANW